MKSLSKKGQVNTLGPAMIALVLASALLIFGLIIMQQTRDTDVITQAESVTATNETVTTLNGTAQNLATVGSRGSNSFAAVTVHNASGGEVIAAGNYSLSAEGAIELLTITYNNTNVNVTYTYLRGGEAYASANETIVGLGTFADFWEIIVLAIVITIVIGLLLVAFAGRRSR